MSESAEPAEIFALHRYFVWSTVMRARFHEFLTAAAGEGKAITHESEEWIETYMWMSYWYASLYVLVEGWRALELHDERVDDLLTSPNVDLLKQYRNGVFHYQRQYYDERFVALIRDGQDVVNWVETLTSEFGRFFLEWLAARKADAGDAT